MSSGKLFKDFVPPLMPEILEAVQSMNFQSATPVQATVVPYFLSHKDVNVVACTGSGKTLAFLIPLFQILWNKECRLVNGQVGAVIISPTRELALQTFSVAQQFEEKNGKAHVILLTGGNEVAEDIKQLHCEKGLVLIATPGRLKDIMERQQEKLSFRELEVLILDEADVLLDLGHATTINYILSKLPKQRRTGLFSATEADGVSALCKAGLRNPVKIKIEIKSHNQVQAVPVLLKNYFVTLPSDAKLGFLLRFLRSHQQEKIIVFFLTCAQVDFLTSALLSLDVLAGIKLRSLHGRMVQKKRLKTMEDFRKPESGVLFCTDVAARGIDIPDVDWIVQFDPPQDPAFFIHRIGRTARAGKKGQSLLMLEPSEAAYVPFTRRRGVPLIEWDEKWDESLRNESLSVLEKIRSKCATSRELYEKSVTGFVANIRAYRNHDCNFILRFEDLDLASLARSFALVRLPKMSELRTKKIDFEELAVDVQSIPYTDPVREKARQERLKKEEAIRATKEEKKKSVKRPPEEKVETKRKKKGKHERIMDEWEELQEEERLYRLYKQKKITDEEYSKQLMSSKSEEKENSFEDRFEKVRKTHQMLRNNQKSRRSHILKPKGMK